MAVPYYGDFPEDQTVYIPFNTFDSNDPSASVTVTNLADADIKVHKDGGVAQIVTDGATIAINFDGITGNHLITIDTSVHADYATGSDYLVRLEGITVDAATLNVWVGSFSLENRFMRGTDSAALASALTTAQNDLDTITGAAGVIIDDSAANDTTISDAVWDEAQSGHVGAGTFGVIATEIADILTDTGTTIPGTITTAQNDLDTITGAAGVIIDDSAANDTVLSDAIWDEAQSGHVGAGTFGIIASEIADILTDTGTTIPGTITTAQNDLDTITGTAGVIIDDSAANDTMLSDAIWDEAIAGHVGVGSTGEALNGASAPTAATVADAVWDEAQADHVGAGSFGVIATEIADILTDTGTTIPGTITTAQNDLNTITGAAGVIIDDSAANDTTISDAVWDEAQSGHVGVGTFGEVATEVAAILVDTAEIGTAGASLTDLGGMSTGMKAEVNAEVDTAWTTTMADSTVADGSIPTREQAMLYLTRFLTEFGISGTTLTVNKEDGTTAVATFTLDDATNPTALTRAT